MRNSAPAMPPVSPRPSPVAPPPRWPRARSCTASTAMPEPTAMRAMPASIARAIDAGIARIAVGSGIAVDAVQDRALGQRGGGATGDGLGLTGGIAGAELRIDDLADRRRRDEWRWAGWPSDGRSAALLGGWLSGGLRRGRRGRSGNRRGSGEQRVDFHGRFPLVSAGNAGEL